ncbi:hypothetical protein B0T22DRAFT_520321 [Podospora appendiculata]|uniref:Uncharacterized protein n=1 Tax=Podospora appendiculata TaxID=314037 RepID=A0AAE0X394_9PEZI|nr:hypothetical protein B0T22DRAFT_520321 [Podospora appendiculata]
MERRRLLLRKMACLLSLQVRHAAGSRFHHGISPGRSRKAAVLDHAWHDAHPADVHHHPSGSPASLGLIKRIITAWVKTTYFDQGPRQNATYCLPTYLGRHWWMEWGHQKFNL